MASASAMNQEKGNDWHSLSVHETKAHSSPLKAMCEFSDDP
jgi:hypothetical protein